MRLRITRIASTTAALVALAGGAARADDGVHWNPAAADHMTQQRAFTVAPVEPIPLGALENAKLSHGATMVHNGKYLDLRDASGNVVARFDPQGRTLEPYDRPVALAITPTSVRFLDAGKHVVMTLPRQ